MINAPAPKLEGTFLIRNLREFGIRNRMRSFHIPHSEAFHIPPSSSPAADPLPTDSPGRYRGEIANRIITETCNTIFSSLARFVSSPERFW